MRKRISSIKLTDDFLAKVRVHFVWGIVVAVIVTPDAALLQQCHIVTSAVYRPVSSKPAEFRDGQKDGARDEVFGVVF